MRTPPVALAVPPRKTRINSLINLGIDSPDIVSCIGWSNDEDTNRVLSGTLTCHVYLQGREDGLLDPTGYDFNDKCVRMYE